MQIELERVDDAFHMVARNDSGNEVHMDASPAVGGNGEGARPMQLVIMALGGCSGIDVLSILRKSRQPVETFRISIEADREEGKVPALFSRIHVHYQLEGDVDVERVRRAIDLSMNKYCSVTRLLEKTVPVTYSFSVNGERHED